MSKIAMRIDAITIDLNGRSSDDRKVRNRILIQVMAPAKVNEHPTSTFTFKGRDGVQLPDDELNKALPYRIAFKNENFEQAFDEPVRIAFHYLQDTKRDIVGKIMGKFVELVVAGLLDGLSVVGVKLGKVLLPEEGLKLSNDFYAQKLGYAVAEIDPASAANGLPLTVSLSAKDDVFHFAFPDGGGKPVKQPVITEGDRAAVIHATVRVS